MARAYIIIIAYAIAFLIAAIGMNVSFAEYPMTTHAGITALIFCLTFFACTLTLLRLEDERRIDDETKGDS